jgi:transposase InsO family protein
LYLNCSRSGYYKSLENKTKADLQQDLVSELVHNIRRYQPRIGAKKLYKLLKADINKMQIRMGRDKFIDFLGRRGLLVKKKRKYVKTTESWHFYHKYKNRIKEKKITAPHQVYVSDITYLRTKQGFVYLFLQTDAYSRLITGWHLSDSLGIGGAIAALKMTLKQCPDPTKVIHHSDRGIQYCCKEYTQLLRENEIIISMTEENHCYENALAERVNGILKQEFLLDAEFSDQRTALRAVKEAIQSYNTLRPHWSLNLSTPMQIHRAA